MLKRKSTIEVCADDIDKSRFYKRANQDGEEKRYFKLDIIETDNTKVVVNKEGEPVEGDTWRLENIGFVTESPTKEERQEKKQMPIIGSETMFVDKEVQGQELFDNQDDAINPEDSPF